ncbi:MAG: crossover junction endodeoxyribonuclease RuvC [Acidimicrobiaceae bacterium]|jgi:crossover junction endodeoxyribonuclease RuvC|nr:crossover junction endodeoxyribonuclease RuvC [Acidimicrobiaceae bacterium]MBO00108.1 crossover junction endodeoxyribonuclease RuvC [Acidimicrobiaceae bacterium]HAY51336.1 crossover junction endodeoxyribonuclease RuvC [Acidimicrobiaceae bacterium]|tara:strand:+ start:2910 stop:3392 length:483 start_codon:yes stop_codon:yes gene_type:complete
MFVLGVDPGLSRCGYGVVQRKNGKENALAAGVIQTPPEMGTPYRLTLLRDEVRELIADYKPDVVAIERVLFQHNAATAISVGQAIGIVMTEGVSAGCEVVEYSPNEVKQAVAGHGGADKEEMEKMVRLLLGIGTPLQPVDAADALALALCYLARKGAEAR